MNHLFSVNLAAFFEERQQEVIRDPTTGQQTGVYIYQTIKLDQFGYFSTKACVPDEFDGL